MSTLEEDLMQLNIFIGKRLREKRRKLGLTLAQVGESLGVSHQQIQKYEQGQTRASAAILHQIAQMYGVNLQFFVQGYVSLYMRHEKRASNVIFHDPNKTLHVLLVEDDPADEFMLRSSLESTNHKINVFSVHDGAQALNFLRYKTMNVDFPRPDFILLDLSIPKRDGLHVLKEIKRDREIQVIPVIVLTNGINAQEMDTVYRNHAAGYISKTSDYQTFQDKITTLISYWSTVAVLPGTAQDQEYCSEDEEDLEVAAA